MKFSILLLLSVIFSVSYCYTYKTNQGIIILNDTNLDIAKRSWNHLLVNFDGGCKWCIQFRAYYLDAYKEAKALPQTYTSRFCQMDLKTNPQSKALYKIEHHPTQLLFVRFDPKSPYKYTGTKNKTKLLAWLKQKLADVRKAGY